MAALILTLILSFVIAGLLWFTLGSRIALAEDSSENDLANLVLYALGALPVSFVIVFFGILANSGLHLEAPKLGFSASMPHFSAWETLFCLFSQKSRYCGGTTTKTMGPPGNHHGTRKTTKKTTKKYDYTSHRWAIASVGLDPKGVVCEQQSPVASLHC